MKSLAINQSRNKLHFTVFHLCLFPKKKKKTKQRTKIIFQEITNQYKSPAFAQKRIASSPASSHADETRCHSSVRISLLTSGHSCGKPSRPSPTPSVSLFRRRYLRSPLKSCVTKKKHKKNIFFFVGRTFAMWCFWKRRNADGGPVFKFITDRAEIITLHARRHLQRPHL